MTKPRRETNHDDWTQSTALKSAAAMPKLLQCCMLDAALAYRSAGLCVIPCKRGEKRPAIRSWLKYQHEMPSEAELRQWFGGSEPYNIAIVCGAVSGNLAVLDFDSKSAFDTWSGEHPDFASTAPVIATARCCHVYVRTHKPVKTTKLASDIDLKAEGGYVIAPPSVHPSGAVYTLLSGDWREIPLVDTVPCHATNAAHASDTPDTIDATITTDTSTHIACVADSALAGDVLDAVRRTLPKGPGQRNRCIFEFARALKAIMPDAMSGTLREIVREWHRQAVSVIRTKDWTTTWVDFVVAWERVQTSEGDTLQAIIERAQAKPTPTIALMYDDPAMRLLVTICECLDEHHAGQPFPFSCRIASEAVQTHHTVAARMLRVLVFDGVLELVTPADVRRRRAAEYRYVREGLQ